MTGANVKLLGFLIDPSLIESLLGWLTQFLAQLNYFQHAWPIFEWLTHLETIDPLLGSLIHFLYDWPSFGMNDPLSPDPVSNKWPILWSLIQFWDDWSTLDMIDPLLGSLTHVLVTVFHCAYDSLYFGINDPTSGWQIHFWDVWPTISSEVH